VCQAERRRRRFQTGDTEDELVTGSDFKGAATERVNTYHRQTHLTFCVICLLLLNAC